jgi:hypothetical protein
MLSLLEDKNHPQAMQAPHDVAFPMEPGMYVLCWQTTAGEEWYEGECLMLSVSIPINFLQTPV